MTNEAGDILYASFDDNEAEIGMLGAIFTS